MATQFAVLGPVRVRCDGRSVPVNGAQPKALLTALLLEANRVVTLERLTELMWDRPPKSATANLRTYATRLRTALGTADGGERCDARLVATASGYRLLVEPEESDLAVFTERMRLGLAALRDAPGQAVALLRSALSLWRGAAAENVPRTAGLTARLIGIEEQRCLATEHLLQARLALGEHEEVVGELHELTAGHPTRERLWGQLVLALYRCGNPAAATAAFGRARDALRRELGIEPGPELAELHRRVLRRDPTLCGALGEGQPAVTLAVPAIRAAARPRAVAPACAPLPGPFVGRTDEVARLVDLLGPATGGRVVAVHGPAGTGKSALAAQVARALYDAGRQGCVWVDMRGTSTDRAPLTPIQAMRRVNALRDAADAPPPLIVFDDVVDEGQVRPLLPALARGAVLITSRPIPTTLGVAEHLDLAPLAAHESRRLLTALCGAQRAEAQPLQLVRLARLCCDLPLALYIAGGRLARRPEWSIGDFVAVLADERCRLDELRHGDLDVRQSFDIGYRALADSPDAADGRAARLFRDLGRVCGGSADAGQAAELLGCNRALAVAALGRLADARLVEPCGAGRYRMTELLRIFAAEQDDGCDYATPRPEPSRSPAPIRLRTTPSRRSVGR